MPWLAAKSGRAAIFGLLSESNEAQNCKANCVQLCRMLIALGEFYSKETKCLQGRGWLQVGSVGSFNILFFLQVIARLRTCIKDSVSVDVCVCVGCLMTVGAVSTCTCIRLLYQKQSVKYEILAAAVVDCAGGMQRERERESKRQMNGLRRHSCHELPLEFGQCMFAGVYCTGQRRKGNAIWAKTTLTIKPSDMSWAFEDEFLLCSPSIFTCICSYGLLHTLTKEIGAHTQPHTHTASSWQATSIVHMNYNVDSAASVDAAWLL